MRVGQKGRRVLTRATDVFTVQAVVGPPWVVVALIEPAEARTARHVVQPDRVLACHAVPSLRRRACLKTVSVCMDTRGRTAAVVKLAIRLGLAACVRVRRRRPRRRRRAGRRRVAAVGVGAVGVAADVRVGVAAVTTVRATTVVLFVWRRVGIAELTADLRIHAAAGRWDLSTV